MKTEQEQKEKYRPPWMVPPVWLLLSVIAMYALDRWLPLLQLWDKPWTHVGVGLVLAGLALDGWGALRFLLAKTGLVPFTPVKTLVTTGPYRFSRNPMYVGMLAIALGAAVFLGSLGPFLVLPVYFLILRNRFVIPEERMLEEVLGEPYLRFKRQRRRWL